MELRCKKCKYKWQYKGKSKFFATCPKCHNLVNIKKQEVKEQG